MFHLGSTPSHGEVGGKVLLKYIEDFELSTFCYWGYDLYIFHISQLI